MAACGSGKALSQDQAVKVALTDAGYTEKQVSDVHIHVTEVDGTPCYNVHFTVDGVSLSYNIHATTGEILSSGEGGH